MVFGGGRIGENSQAAVPGAASDNPGNRPDSDKPSAVAGMKICL
jgi:hypothetical protein